MQWWHECRCSRGCSTDDPAGLSFTAYRVTVATVVDLCKQSKVIQMPYWYICNEPLYAYYVAIRIVVRMVVLRSKHRSTHGSFLHYAL